MDFVMIASGLALLIVGAHSLIRGASHLAAIAGLSPLVIGLTVVAFGTSAPELGVSVQASLSGEAGIAIGNVVGSNIFNVLFILGLSAMIIPLVVSPQLVRFDVPIMIGFSILVLLFAQDGYFGKFEGFTLAGGILLYIVVVIYQGKRAEAAEPQASDGAEKPPAISGSSLKSALFIVFGLALLMLGSSLLVDGAVAVATLLGVSELVIGLTIIAAGTSLPEVVTSILAAVQGQRDIAVGNVIGSNIFNLAGVLGVAALVSPYDIPISPAAVAVDIPVMVAVAILCLPLFFTGGGISRAEGALLFSYYISYTTYIVLTALQHPLLPQFSAAFLYLVIPLTVLTIALIAARQLFRR